MPNIFSWLVRYKFTKIFLINRSNIEFNFRWALSFFTIAVFFSWSSIVDFVSKISFTYFGSDFCSIVPISEKNSPLAVHFGPKTNSALLGWGENSLLTYLIFDDQ